MWSREPCRFGGERPWFMCSMARNNVYCWRRVIKLYGAGRFFRAATAIGSLMRANRNRPITAGLGNPKRSECGWAEARTCLCPTDRANYLSLFTWTALWVGDDEDCTQSRSKNAIHHACHSFSPCHPARLRPAIRCRASRMGRESDSRQTEGASCCEGSAREIQCATRRAEEARGSKGTSRRGACSCPREAKVMPQSCATGSSIAASISDSPTPTASHRPACKARA